MPPRLLFTVSLFSLALPVAYAADPPPLPPLPEPTVQAPAQPPAPAIAPAEPERNRKLPTNDRTTPFGRTQKLRDGIATPPPLVPAAPVAPALPAAPVLPAPPSPADTPKTPETIKETPKEEKKEALATPETAKKSEAEKAAEPVAAPPPLPPVGITPPPLATPALPTPAQVQQDPFLEGFVPAPEPVTETPAQAAEKKKPKSPMKQLELPKYNNANKNFKTQNLSPIISKKTYDTQNRHLPPIRYEEEYNKMLLLASGKGDLSGINAIVAEYNNLNYSDPEGNTALMYATGGGKLDAVRLLLGKGAEPNAQNGKGFTPLYVAVYNNFYAIARALLAAGANANIADTQGVTPFSLAMQRGDNQMIDLILQYSGDLGAALRSAAKSGNVPLMAILLEKGAPINGKDKNGDTALILAARACKRPAVTMLLNRGANPNIKDITGANAAQNAEEQGCTYLAPTAAAVPPSTLTPLSPPAPVTGGRGDGWLDEPPQKWVK